MQSEVCELRLAPGYDSEKATPAFKIFHQPYDCTMALMHLSTIEAAEQLGVPTTGQKDMDRTMALQKVHVRLTISGMAELMDDQIPFEICNINDTLPIYQTIFDHLQDWQHYIQRNVGARWAPIEDLRLLDALAADMYVYARGRIKINPFHGNLMTAIANISSARGGMTRRLGSAPSTGVVASPVLDPNVPQKHAPMADSISQTITERTKPWR